MRLCHACHARAYGYKRDARKTHYPTIAVNRAKVRLYTYKKNNFSFGSVIIYPRMRAITRVTYKKLDISSSLSSVY